MKNGLASDNSERHCSYCVYYECVHSQYMYCTKLKHRIYASRKNGCKYLKFYKNNFLIVKTEALNKLQDMYGCTTVMRSTDVNGNNENYSAVATEFFFDEGYAECLTCEDWKYIGCKHATIENTDMSIWAQEMDTHRRHELTADLEEDALDIITFRNDKVGTIEIIVW